MFDLLLINIIPKTRYKKYLLPLKGLTMIRIIKQQIYSKKIKLKAVFIYIYLECLKNVPSFKTWEFSLNLLLKNT